MQLNKDVAIKFFGQHFASDRYTREAFSRESQALQALDHPNIVRVLDGGRDTEDGSSYLVLEWLESNLSELIASKPFGGWDDFYEMVGRPILQALTHAYGKGIIHRDLKPQNILMTASNVPQVSDFGIAKFKSNPQPGVTMTHFRTEPYAPPEKDDGKYSDTRDVYSFAVLALECLCEDVRMESYDAVYAALDQLDAPAEVTRVLHACLDRDPSARPTSIVELAEKLARIQAPREKGWVSVPVCYLSLKQPALAAVMKDNPGLDDTLTRRFILDDLRAAVAIRRGEAREARSEKNQEELTLQFVTARYRYTVVVDRIMKDHLVMVRAVPGQSSFLDKLRSDAWSPELEFRSGQPPVGVDGERFIAWLVSGLMDYEEEQQSKRADERRDRIFRTWEQILNAKEALERSQYKAISFRGVELIPPRIRLATVERSFDASDEDLTGQPWYIPLPGGGAISGEIDSISEGAVTIWCSRMPDTAPPESGQLLFDTRASRSALGKQRAALDAIRFELCARPELKALLADPSRAKEPTRQDPAKFFQDNLDQDKRRVVATALGTSDFLFVEGPPGTGKTKFITELTLQVLTRNPNARVLLTSQTHVALDNALEQLTALAPGLKCVRIGRRNDARVSDSVRQLLLENKADEWLVEVAKNSKRFLDEWAVSHNLNRAEIELGIAVSRLRLALLEEQKRRLSVEDQERTVEALRINVSSQETKTAGTTYDELSERLRQAEDALSSARDDLTNAQRRTRQTKQLLAQAHDLGKDLSSATADELREWEADLLDRNDATRRCKELIELIEEWQLRFGKSSDFHGAILEDAQVVAGTCIGFAGARGVSEIEFDICIVDEASKATVTELLVPLSRARSWVIVGDRQQLPPFIEDALEKPEILTEYGISERELNRTLLDHLAENLPATCQTMLTEQHRMCAAIGTLVSECFYYGKLSNARIDNEYRLGLAIPKPVTWFSTSKLSNRYELWADPSFKNLREVAEAITLLKRINWVAKVTNSQYTVAFLAAYSAQRIEFDRAFASVRADLPSIDVQSNTVDAFQGREADVVVYSITRSNREGRMGFIREARRLNVALSRAKDTLGIIGDHAFCRAKPGNPFICVVSHIISHSTDCELVELEP